MKKMIAYCGLDCEKCDAYIAPINNDDALREKTAKLWAKMNNAPITAAMIHCMSCRMDGVKTPFCARFHNHSLFKRQKEKAGTRLWQPRHGRHATTINYSRKAERGLYEQKN